MIRWSFRYPLRVLSASLAAALAAGTSLSPTTAQSRQGTWFSLESAAPSPSPLRQQLERIVTDVLAQAYGGLSQSTGTPATLTGMLASRAPTDLIFIAGRADDIAAFVRNDRFQIIERLKLEVVNARLGVVPFYLFTNGDKARNLRQPSTPPRVLYASRAGALQPGEVQQLIVKVLGTQPAVSVPLNSPDELARRLLADNQTGGVDVVGIYDEDPSPFLHEFLRAYDVQRSSGAGPGGDQRLVQMLVFPTGTTTAERDRLGTGRLQPIQGNLTFALVRFDDVAIEALDNVAPPRKDGVLAVSVPPGDNTSDSLWVLSNVRSVAGEEEQQRLHRLLGDASFVGLMASDDFQRRCERGSRRQYGMYLLDAQVADRQNVAKALAFWSDLMLRSGTGRPVDLARLADQRTVFETVLRQRLNVQLDTRAGRADLASRLRGTRPTAREEFSDADGTLFQRALDDIQAGLQSSDRAVRSKQLAGGRSKLVALIEKGSGPACRGKDLGLFGRGLDPFFYLALVDAYAALDSAIQPARTISPMRPR
jgi:hypothetical protein